MTSWKEGKILAGHVNEVKKRVREIIKNKTGVAVEQLIVQELRKQLLQEIELKSFYLRLKNDKC